MLDKKSEQLGMPFGTANGRLKKLLLFELVCQAGRDTCYQCGERIENPEHLSVEHKTPWLDSENPRGLFFDTENISFSHLSCNFAARRQTREQRHPSVHAYKTGCRCGECRVLANEHRNRYARVAK